MQSVLARWRPVWQNGHMRIALLLSVLAALTLTSSAQDLPPWPSPVTGHVPPKPGEHPRLLFRKSDLPKLRERAKTKEGQAIIARLKTLLGEGGGGLGLDLDDLDAEEDDAKAKPHTISHVAGYGFLHLITGQKEYADKARQRMEDSMKGIPDDDKRYSWKAPNGALRAGPSLGWHAVGYDLAYEGWSPAFRKKVALEIQKYSRGRHCSLPELVRGSRHMPGSNHWGMQVGGGALAVLAIRGDPGVDNRKIEELIKISQKSMIRNLTEGFGDHGSFAEGDGTGVMSSHISFLPALQAWRVAAGLDYCSPRPNARWTCLKWVMLTIVRNGKPDFPSRGGYPQNVWSRGGMSGVGTFCQGFGIVNEEEKPALIWLYNRASRQMDEKANAPFETASRYPHRCILALVNWPFGLKEKNPAEILPKLVVDEWSGRCMFRNRWQDQDDIIVDAQLKSTRGWMGVGAGQINVWGLNKKSVFPMTMAGEPTVLEPGPNGGVVSTEAQSLGVDFSGKSGADAVIVMVGTGEAPKTPGKAKTLKVGGDTWTVMTLQNGNAPEITVEDKGIRVGKQKITFTGKKIVFDL